MISKKDVLRSVEMKLPHTDAISVPHMVQNVWNIIFYKTLWQAKLRGNKAQPGGYQFLNFVRIIRRTKHKSSVISLA